MSEFQVRADAVDVEQIMRQIRARIREKRGADYTEQEIKELASVKLEKFLDPRGVRSNLVQEFRRNRVVTPAPPTVGIGEVDVFGSPRPILRALRKLFSPILRLMFSPTPLVHAVNSIQRQQNEINAEFHKRFRQREEMDPLYYEVIHNLVVELTRVSIENHNLKMRVESLSSRMDFDERRARALESVVQYKPAPRAERGDQQPRAAGHKSEGSPAGDAPRAEGASDSQRAGGAGDPQRAGGAGDPQRAGGAGDPLRAGGAGDPLRAGLDPRDGGERGERRRRRRRRRRPGQNLAGQGNGQGDPSGADASDAGHDHDAGGESHDGGTGADGSTPGEGAAE
jgi:hypothetical protein